MIKNKIMHLNNFGAAWEDRNLRKSFRRKKPGNHSKLNIISLPNDNAIATYKTK